MAKLKHGMAHTKLYKAWSDNNRNRRSVRTLELIGKNQYA